MVFVADILEWIFIVLELICLTIFIIFTTRIFRKFKQKIDVATVITFIFVNLSIATKVSIRSVVVPLIAI
jgi:hypothetical protein